MPRDAASTSAPLPPRIGWAVAQLPRAVDGPVLEIGCGGGHALPALLARFPGAPVTAIDRSAVQIARARARLRAQADAGRLRLEALDLDGAADVLGRGAFALALAVNVNAYWTSPREALRATAELLRADGRLYLVCEPPGARQLQALRKTLPDVVAAHGFRVADVRSAALDASKVLLLAAERSSR